MSMIDVTKDDAVRADLAHVLHPFATLGPRDADDLLMVDRADGLRLWDVDGNVYVDARSGLFNVNVGWGRKELGDVAGEAVTRYGYVSLFFESAHVPAAQLGAKLAEITPGEIDRFLFTLGGSDAIETVIKVARLYHAARGASGRQKLIARADSYHGCAMGGTSLTGSPAAWEGISPMVPGVLHIPQPDPADPDAARLLEQAILAAGPETVAAFVAEPVSNPSAITVPGPDYWPAVREICSRYGVLLISDETISGFGRTGRMFACEHWGLEPDMIVMSKGLTSGYQPLGAAGIRGEIIDTIGATGASLLHGFTSGGHPAACAVALANIEIMEREGLVENAAAMGEHLRARLVEAAGRTPQMRAVRALGLWAAVDLVPTTRTDFAPSAGYGEAVQTWLRQRGLLVRRYGDSILFGPPLIVTASELDEIVEQFEDAVRTVDG